MAGGIIYFALAGLGMWWGIGTRGDAPGFSTSAFQAFWAGDWECGGIIYFALSGLGMWWGIGTRGDAPGYGTSAFQAFHEKRNVREGNEGLIHSTVLGSCRVVGRESRSRMTVFIMNAITRIGITKIKNK